MAVVAGWVKIRPRINVIVPLYNAEKTLHRCIDSIRGQSFKDYELILVDDGSTDGSGDICDAYAGNAHNINVVHKENQGVSHTRNTGLQNAVGKYILFVDSDDWIEERMLEKMVTAMTGKTDLVICGYNRVIYNEDYRLEKRIITENLTEIKVVDFLEGFHSHFESKSFCAIWNKLFRADLINNNRISFNEMMSLGEDIIFNLDYLKKSRSIIYIEDSLYNYVVFSDNRSLSTRFNPNRLAVQVMIYTSIIDLLKEFEQFNRENEAYFNKAYSKAIVVTVINYLTKSKGTYRERRNYLTVLYENREVMSRISLFHNGGLDKNIIAWLIILRSKIILPCISR